MTQSWGLPLKKTTILLVESDVILRFSLSDYLRMCGLRVIEAATLNEAIAVLQKGPRIDIVFGDAGAGDKPTDLKLSMWIQQIRPAVEVALTHGLSAKADAAEALCQAHGAAPYPAVELKAKISTLQARVRRASAKSKAPGGRWPLVH